MHAPAAPFDGVSNASAIVVAPMLVGERRWFSLFCFSNLAEGHAKNILRRSTGRKAGKREKVMEKKRGFVFSIRQLRRRTRGGKLSSMKRCFLSFVFLSSNYLSFPLSECFLTL